MDGASTDNTVEVLKSFGDIPELNWVSEPDDGVVDAVNKGFAKARGEIAAIQSSDDYYLPGAVRAAVDLLGSDPDIHFVFGDIWKSFIAQCCLWAMDLGVVFHAPEVIQERNEHNLMKDFEDEIPGYMNNNRIAEVLAELSLDPGVSNVWKNLRTCYAALIAEGFFPEKELALVDRWLVDAKSCC